MAKRLILFILLFMVFILCMFFGGNWDVIRLTQQVAAMQNHTTAWNPIPSIHYVVGRYILIANGILFATALMVLIALLQAFTRRSRSHIPITLAAWLIAIFAGLALKFGLTPASF